MKIGFVDVAGNKANSYSVAVNECENQAGVTLARYTSPELSKIPVCAKKLFSEQNVDAVLCFAEVDSENEKELLWLVQEKLVDVEVACNAFVFFTWVDDSEWRTDQELQDLCVKRVTEKIQEIVEFTRLPPEQQQAIQQGSVFDMFNPQATVPRQAGAEEVQESATAGESVMEEEGVHSLF